MIPPQIRGQKYVALATFRRSGAAVFTPVWFGEGDGKLYVKTPHMIPENINASAIILL